MAKSVILSESQNTIFQRIISSISTPRPNGSVFLIKGAAGTGKTFLLNQIMRHCEGENIKAIALAYTGIASCLLLKGKTVHSHFRIPWNRQQITCEIESNYPVYKTIRKASVLLWDQAAFCSKNIIEEVNRFLQVMMNSKQLFGGKVVVMCVDFRECLPIVKRTQYESPESQSILFSELYGQMQHFTLHENFRFINQTDYRFCLDIGSGALKDVFIPNECRIYNMDTLISTIYGNYASLSTDEIMKRSILTVIEDEVDFLNSECRKRFLEGKHICSSINFFEKIEKDERSRFYNMDNIMENLPKYFPPDTLVLTENCPIMLRQAYRGLAAGTRLIVKSVSHFKIIAEIGVGQRKGKQINIYRVLTKKVFHNGNVQFIRRQFPISLAFAMTINRAQGLEFQRMGLYFPCTVFAHGQMYVAFSRVPDIKQNLSVLVTGPNNAQVSYDRMPNVVNPNITKYLQP